AVNAEREAAERERAVENAVTAVADLLSDWARALDERVRPAAELLEGWTRRVSGLTAARQPAPVLAAAISRDHLLPARRPLDQKRADLNRTRRDNETARADTEAELANLETERDPRPRGPEFWQRRDRPDGVGVTGAPLWRLVETSEPDAPVAQLEAAMDAAGLLQAWVTPDGVYVAGRDGSDVIWTAPPDHGPPDHGPPDHGPPGPGPSGSGTRSLRAVLRPADDAGVLAGIVAGLLGSVTYGDDLPAGTTAIGADGRWRHGG